MAKQYITPFTAYKNIKQREMGNTQKDILYLNVAT